MTHHELFGPAKTGDYFEDLFYIKVGKGPPIIALHGFGATSFSWRHVASALKNCNSLYLFDLRGHGQSKCSKGLSFRLIDQAKTIANFVDQTGLEAVSLIGHSMGGAIALLAAAELIRNNHSISSIVLIDSVGLPQRLPWFFKVARNSFLARLITRVVPASAIVRLILYFAFFKYSKISSRMVAAYAKNLGRSDSPDSFIQTAQHMVPADFSEHLSILMTLNAPTLIISGSNDAIVPPSVAIGLNVVLQNSHLEFIDSCGHVPHEECYERVNPILLRFLHPLVRVCGG